MKKILTIIFTSIVLGFIYNSLSPDGLPLIRQEIQIQTVELPDGTEGNDNDTTLRGITLESAIKLLESGDVVFIDARDQWDFSEGHIPGAINIPEFSFEPDDAEVSFLDKDARYVIYCEGDDCDVSKRLASELQKLSFTNLYVYIGGYKEWIESGNKIEKSELE